MKIVVVRSLLGGNVFVFRIEEGDMMGSFVQIVNEDPNCKTNCDVQIPLQCIEEFHRYLGERIAYLRTITCCPMNREELLSAVEALVEDGATPLERHIARETIYDFIGSITDEDTQEVVDQLCVECMDETKKSRAAAQLSEYIRILVPE